MAAAAAIVIGLVGAGLSFRGSQLQAQAQEEQLAAQEEAATANAQQARENALIVRRESRKRAEQAVRGGEELKSTQRAAFGKAGVLLTGTPQDILEETERVTREDVEAILMAGDIGSREALFQASQQAAQARSLRRARAVAPQATLLSGAATATSTASSAFR